MASKVGGYELVPDIHFMVVTVLYHKICYWILQLVLVLNTMFLLSDVCLVYQLGLSPWILMDRGVTPYFQTFAYVTILAIIRQKEIWLRSLIMVKNAQWPMKNMSDTIRNQIRGIRVAFAITCLLVALYLIVAFPGVFKLLFVQYIIDHYPYNFVVFVLMLFSINGIFLAWSIILVPFFTLYLTFLWVVQIELLNDLVCGFTEDKNKELQSHGLKIIAARQVELRQQYLNVRDTLAAASIQTILGIITYTAFVVYSYLKGHLARSVLLVHFLTFFLFYTYVTVIGQRYEDKWRTFNQLLGNIPWYELNTPNRKMYLLILTGASKTPQYLVWNSLAMNYELYLQVWKTLYTVTNALCNLKGKYSF